MFERCAAALFFLVSCLIHASPAAARAGEQIVYSISPLGTSIYTDKGFVDYNGQRLRHVVFKTSVPGFSDTETIYGQPQTLLPVHIERDISWPLKQEFIVEEYEQERFLLTISKYKRDKIIWQKIVQKDGPIHNAILLPFLLRDFSEPRVGWTFKARIPIEFDIKLIAFERVKVPAGEFETWRFESVPEKFEIWISRDARRIPVKIREIGGLGYTMVMKEYHSSQQIGDDL